MLLVQDNRGGSATPTPHRPSDSESLAVTRTISGIIQIMWGSLSRLWLDHLKTIHDHTKTTQSPVTLASLKDQVWLIHARQPETLPIHQHYFHADLEAFLQKATIQSLQLYIQHYLPVIKRRIRLRLDSLHEEIVNDEHR